MLPSYQGFESHDLIRGQRDDGLKDEPKFTALERAFHVSLQLEVGLFRLHNSGIENSASGAAQHSGSMQRRFGIAQDVGSLQIPSRAHGKANARREEDISAANDERSKDLSKNAITD